MATKTNRVSKEEWDKHKSTILGLYCERGLPLTQVKNAQDEHESVGSIMKHQYSFVASKSQYEAQLKRWGATKNLKQIEWVSLLSDHDRLERQGKEVRIVIFRQVQTREKINKARHRYMKRSSGATSTASLSQAVASNSHSFVEVKNDGHWSRYHTDNTLERTDALASGSHDPPHDDDGHEEATPSLDTSFQSSQYQLTLYRDLTIPDQPMDMEIPPENNALLDIGPISPSRLEHNTNTFGISPGPELYWQNFAQEFLTFDSDLDQPTSPQVAETGRQDGDVSLSASIHYSHADNQVVANTSSSSSLDAPANLQTTFALALQDKFNAASHHNSTSAFEIRALADRFTSLLSDTSFFWGTLHSTIFVKPGSMADPALFNGLLYSIINGFAGAEEVSPASILGVLRQNRGFFSHVSNLIRSGPDTVSKPIVDNLLPVAIKARDADAVASLLQAIQNHPGILTDLNKSVFRVSGEVYTPIELAVDSGSTEVVRLILEAGADPNTKTEQRATMLSLAISDKDFKKRYPTLGIVRALLDHGAEIDVSSMGRAVDYTGNNNAVLMELVQRLPDNQHRTCFSWPKDRLTPGYDTYSMRLSRSYRHQVLVEDMIIFLANKVATSLVTDLIGKCMSTNCKKCVFDKPIIVTNMLFQAARRSNLELVEFLAQYPTSLHEALVGAIRSGDFQLIEFLIEKGARADGPAVYFTINLGYRQTLAPSTALAEAIRREDEQLVHTLTDYGAWRRLDDEQHTEAAIIAAAEVGSVRYLEAVLRRNTSGGGLSLTALEMAISRRNTECALVLLRSGKNLTKGSIHNNYIGPLLAALDVRNKDITRVLLDCGAYGSLLDKPDNKTISPMELAGQWGDMEIIEAIASMGANLNVGHSTTALAAAVASRNRPLVDHLLDLGADSGAKAIDGCSPLSEAVKNKDYPMIDHLLSKGATPADTSAFLTAMEHDQTTLTKLASAVKQIYPFGIRGFGWELMASAILKNNAADVSLWLDLNINPAMMADRDRLIADPQRSGNREGRVSLLGLAIELAKDDDRQVIDLLLRYGTSVNALAAEQVKYMGTISIAVFETPLLLAIATRNRKTVNLLFENGADINRPARLGVFSTPLQEACKIGSYELVEFLLQKGAEINSPAARRFGGTALQMAAQCGSLKIVELLLLNKADPHAPGSEFGFGGTAFEFAAEYGRYHILLLLWRTAPAEGFTSAILNSARDRAEKNGHRGCVGFIADILHDASFGRMISEGL